MAEVLLGEGKPEFRYRLPLRSAVLTVSFFSGTAVADQVIHVTATDSKLPRYLIPSIDVDTVVDIHCVQTAMGRNVNSIP